MSRMTGRRRKFAGKLEILSSPIHSSVVLRLPFLGKKAAVWKPRGAGSAVMFDGTGPVLNLVVCTCRSDEAGRDVPAQLPLGWVQCFGHYYSMPTTDSGFQSPGPWSSCESLKILRSGRFQLSHMELIRVLGTILLSELSPLFLGYHLSVVNSTVSIGRFPRSHHQVGFGRRGARPPEPQAAPQARRECSLRTVSRLCSEDSSEV
jgi:hypothetical protein